MSIYAEFIVWHLWKYGTVLRCWQIYNLKQRYKIYNTVTFYVCWVGATKYRTVWRLLIVCFFSSCLLSLLIFMTPLFFLDFNYLSFILFLFSQISLYFISSKAYLPFHSFLFSLVFFFLCRFFHSFRSNICRVSKLGLLIHPTQRFRALISAGSNEEDWFILIF